MELRTLRYFVAVAESGSLSAAADVVLVTQPALSRQLRQFERELGVRLFHRPGRALELTAAGREFLPLAREVLGRADSARRAATDLAAGGLGRLGIAAPATTLTDVIAPFLATFGPGDPIPTVLEADGPTAVAALSRGIDLAIVTQPPQRPLMSRPVAVLPLFAYVPAEHRWAGRARVELGELAVEPLVVLDRSFRARQILDEAFTAEQLEGGPLLECSNPQVAQALAAAGRGAAVVSDDPRFDLVPLRLDGAHGPLQIRLFAAWQPGHHAAGTLVDISRRLSEFVSSRYG
ncbi:LysR family transcriptional regulator [Micromonospora sp. NPDC048830]|uniref:LysR family transcriptional regulator n=1 Tax=Micromonospora sp. NPDC048830 TaxID=3364257 RepID=UPI003719CC47